MSYVIFDLDNCLADDRHRHNLLPTPLEHTSYTDDDYAAYHERMNEDEPINLGVVRNWANSGTTILIVTARPERYRAATEEWLFNSCVLAPENYTLLMRPSGNRMHSPMLKVMLVTKWLAARNTELDKMKAMAAYDDRADVLRAYVATGLVSADDAWQMDHAGRNTLAAMAAGVPAKVGPRDVFKPAHEILREMATTYEERNKVYGSNFLMVGEIMVAMFPDGVVLRTVEDFNRWHLFELKVVKLSRFAISGLTHKDSIHDDGVYSAMVEALINRDTQPITGVPEHE